MPFGTQKYSGHIQSKIENQKRKEKEKMIIYNHAIKEIIIN
jgi:hypothetical protein